MEIRRNKDGSKRYREILYIEGQRVRSPAFKRKEDAKQWKAKELVKREEYKVYGHNYYESLHTTLSEYVLPWLETHVKPTRAPSTYLEYKRVFHKKLLPLFGDRKLVTIKPSDGYLLIRKLQEQGHNVGGINLILSLFKQVLNQAVKDDLLLKSPLISIAKLPKVERPPTYWQDDDTSRFLLAVEEDYLYAFYLTALHTGMRRGELCGLKWDKVNFSRSLIEVSRIRDRHGLRETTKNKKTRLVPMNSFLNSVLQKLYSRRSSDFVFASQDGAEINAHHVYRDFRKLQEKANTSLKIRFHDLRHTFASHFMMKGGNLYDLQKILGHHDVSMTQIYAHLSPEHLSEVTEILSFGKDKERSNEDKIFQRVEKDNSPKTAPRQLIAL